MKMKIKFFLVVVLLYGFFGCRDNFDLTSFFEQAGISNLDYNNAVFILDGGCNKCRDQVMDFALLGWPENTALIFRRKISQSTLEKYGELFNKDFVFHDTLDISTSCKQIGLNDELVWLNVSGEFLNFQLYQYEEILNHLRKQ